MAERRYAVEVLGFPGMNPNDAASLLATRLGIGLPHARQVVGFAPVTVRDGLSSDAAKQLAKVLLSLGADVRINGEGVRKTYLASSMTGEVEPVEETAVDIEQMTFDTESLLELPHPVAGLPTPDDVTLEPSRSVTGPDTLDEYFVNTNPVPRFEMVSEVPEAGPIEPPIDPPSVIARYFGATPSPSLITPAFDEPAISEAHVDDALRRLVAARDAGSAAMGRSRFATALALLAVDSIAGRVPQSRQKATDSRVLAAIVRALAVVWEDVASLGVRDYVDERRARLMSISQQLDDLAYPFRHPNGRVSVGRVLIPEDPDLVSADRIDELSVELAARSNDLYVRVLACLVVIAESVEVLA